MKKYISIILKSLLIVISIVCIQGIIHSAVSVFGFVELTSYIVLSCIVAPITEEYAKRYAIINKFPYIFTTILVIFESSLYALALLYEGFTLPVILFARFFPAVIHFIALTIQIYYHKKNRSIFGYWMGVLIHAFWNVSTI